MAVCGGGEGGDAAARPGDGVPLHASDPGVPLAAAGRHGAGALPRPRAHMEDPRLLCPGLRGGVRRGGGVASPGEWSDLYLQVLRGVPVRQRGGE